MAGSGDSSISIIFILVAVGLGIWLYLFLPAQMAGKRNRSAMVWVLIALVGSPLLAILLLIALGDAKAG